MKFFAARLNQHYVLLRLHCSWRLSSFLRLPLSASVEISFILSFHVDLLGLVRRRCKNFEDQR